MERTSFGILLKIIQLRWFAALMIFFSQIIACQGMVSTEQSQPAAYLKNYPHNYDYNCFTNGGNVGK